RSPRVIIQAVSTRDALTKIGGEAKTTMIGDDVFMFVAIDRIMQFEAEAETVPQKFQDMATHTVAHEFQVALLPEASKELKTAKAFGVGAAMRQQIAGPGGAMHFASSVNAQFALGKVSAKMVSSDGLAEKVGEVFAGKKELKSDSVAKLAEIFAE